MIKIYHNPRCRKSREGVQFLESMGKEFEIIKYLDTPLSFEELSIIIKQLNVTPEGLVRKNEKIWKDNFKGKVLSDNEITQALVDFPKLIERPIITYQNKAVIGRPAEEIEKLF